MNDKDIKKVQSLRKQHRQQVTDLRDRTVNDQKNKIEQIHHNLALVTAYHQINKIPLPTSHLLTKTLNLATEMLADTPPKAGRGKKHECK